MLCNTEINTKDHRCETLADSQLVSAVARPVGFQLDDYGASALDREGWNCARRKHWRAYSVEYDDDDDACSDLDSWIVPGWLPRGIVTVLLGKNSDAIARLAQQLMTSCSTAEACAGPKKEGGSAVAGYSRTWLGLDVRPCPSIGLFCNDSREELRARQHAINAEFGKKPRSRTLACLAGTCSENHFLQFDDHGDLHTLCSRPKPFVGLEALSKQARKVSARLIVIAGLNQTFGGDVHNLYQASVYTIELQNLAYQTDAAVLLLADELCSDKLHPWAPVWDGAKIGAWSLADEGGSAFLRRL